MAETLVQQSALLASQLAAHLPTDRAQILAQLLAALRAGRIDPTTAQERLASDESLLEAVHRLAARAVTLQIAGSALGVMFGKDADLRIATITIGDVVRRKSVQAGAAHERAQDDSPTTYHAVFHLPPAARRLLACQPPYPLEQPIFGRERELEFLATRLNIRGNGAPAPVVIIGPQGVGKRLLASSFAQQLRQLLPGGIFWIRAGQPEEIPIQVASCGGPGGLDLPGWSGLSLEAQIAAVYDAWREPTPRLLVLEDVQDATLLARWAPHGGGCRVLVTTTAWNGQEATLPLGPLPRAVSLRLLLDGCARSMSVGVDALLADATQAQIAGAICDELHDTPFAIALAGQALAAPHPRIALSTYLGRVAQLVRSSGALGALRLQASDEAIRRSGSVFLIAIELLRTQPRVGTIAIDLLRRVAQCASAPLPGDLLPRLLGVTPESGADWDTATAALRQLQQFGLLVAVGEHIWMHPIVAQLTRSLLPIGSDERAIERGLIASANAVHSKQQPWDGLALVPHLVRAATLLGQRSDDGAATLLLNLGYLLQQIGDLQRARPVYDRALTICTDVLGQDHPATARILSNIGRLLQDENDPTEARAYYERAIAITERIHGKETPPVARVLHRLGALQESIDDFEGARSFYERELAIYIQVFGTENPDTASSMITLGHLLQNHGAYQEARALYEHALEVCEQVLGTNHPATARTLHGLGLLAEQQGDMTSALGFYERALAIREHALGPQHPDTARSLHVLGYLHHVQDSFDQAADYYQRALAIREKVLGPLHPDTASTLNNIGHLAELQGDMAAAQRFYERALLICTHALGADHPNTEVARQNLAEVEARLHKG